ncbi:flavodoxin [Massilimaliae timonensis]|uniref:Flavodoxin n=1 Tax=Massiliimalia timonensis TaxID=1987501 RepID=A0A8J6PCV5_9FIRM|nr:flavodoxin [Massiliimalia timonensis]MBC8609662.1 flavodoxin [Massiliimalia timonensis]
MADLIAYFSRKHENYVSGTIQNLNVGNTEVAAGIIQRLTGADLFKIEPLQEYSKNYNECIAQAQADQRRDARPELKGYPAETGQYNRIYLGYPNYWSTMPMAVFTFLEHFDFAGKIILPFCTHEGSGLGSSIKDIKRLCPDSIVKKGLEIRGGNVQNSEEEIRDWIWKSQK